MRNELPCEWLRHNYHVQIDTRTANVSLPQVSNSQISTNTNPLTHSHIAESRRTCSRSAIFCSNSGSTSSPAASRMLSNSRVITTHDWRERDDMCVYVSGRCIQEGVQEK
jgi:hypothetical protein